MPKCGITKDKRGGGLKMVYREERNESSEEEEQEEEKEETATAKSAPRQNPNAGMTIWSLQQGNTDLNVLCPGYTHARSMPTLKQREAQHGFLSNAGIAPWPITMTFQDWLCQNGDIDGGQTIQRVNVESGAHRIRKLNVEARGKAYRNWLHPEPKPVEVEDVRRAKVIRMESRCERTAAWARRMWRKLSDKIKSATRGPLALAHIAPLDMVLAAATFDDQLGVHTAKLVQTNQMLLRIFRTGYVCPEGGPTFARRLRALQRQRLVVPAPTHY